MRFFALLPILCFAGASFFRSPAQAEPPLADPIKAALTKIANEAQQSLELPVRVVDENGRPVAGARVNPWALRSSQGHGLWRAKDKGAELDPVEVRTDAKGEAIVNYPKFRSLRESVRTIGVSLAVNHPEFAYAGDLHIDVPLEKDGLHEIKLKAGVALEVRPLVNGQSPSKEDFENIFVQWSDVRSRMPENGLQRLDGGVFRIPALAPGQNSVMLVLLDGERATHLSKIVDVEVTAGETKRIDVPLAPSVQFRGKLSDNVPRPVNAGRVKVRTLMPTAGAFHRVAWNSWAPIAADGTFVVDSWPSGEPMQLTALCDGFMAASGKAPECVKNPLDPAKDPFARPQVFTTEQLEIDLPMTPLVRCEVKVVDEEEQPVAGVDIVSSPNVGWWNGGSQIYCNGLSRSETSLRDRDPKTVIETPYEKPFWVATGPNGEAVLELPAGSEDLTVFSEVYELPVLLGRRDVDVKLTSGETTEVVLRLQPKGTDKLGEWDKLAGVVFGCSTREGRRICALPGVTKKMDEFAERFREGANQRNPQLLFEAYTTVADAFVGVGDHDEAEKWRQKAAEQKAKITALPAKS
jgi:hypothetical protein